MRLLMALIIRQMSRRPRRTWLTLCSIVIGVAAIVAVQSAIGNTRAAYRQMRDVVAGNAPLEVAGHVQQPFDQAIVNQVQQITGVVTAVPQLRRFTVLFAQGKRLQLLTTNLDSPQDAVDRQLQLESGRFCRGKGELVLEQGIADGLGISVDQKVRLLTRRGAREFTVVGLVRARGLGEFRQAGTVYLPLESAQRHFGKLQQVDRIAIRLAEGADVALVQRAIAEVLPATLDVKPPAERQQFGQEAFLNAEQGLQFASLMTVILAVFIVLNTFLMNVSERQRELAILRAIGATRRQTMCLIAAEGLLLGAIGTAVGCLMGLGGAWLLSLAMAHLRGAEPPPFHWNIVPLLWAAVLGPGVALLGSCLPVRLAGRVTPLEAMRGVRRIESPRMIGWLAVVGVLTASLSGAGLALALRGVDWLPIGAVVPLGGLFMASFTLILPALLRPLAEVVALVLRRRRAVEMQLAKEQLLQHRARSGLTIGVLSMAVATATGLGTTIVNHVDDVRQWHRRTMAGDFFIRSMVTDPAAGATVAMADAIGEQLRGLPGVLQINTLRLVSARIGKQPALVVISDVTQADRLPLHLSNGEPDAVMRRLRAGEVVIGSVLAQRNGIAVGDAIAVELPGGVQTLKVAGTSVEYLHGGMMVFMERTAAAQLFAVEGADVFIVQAESAFRSELERRLNLVGREHGLLVHSFADISRLVDSLTQGVLWGLWGLLGVGFLVATLGIANTMTMNVLEQTHEIGLLRVLAMTGRQVRIMIFAQSTIMGIIGLVVGSITGINTAFVIRRCMQPLLGYTVPFALSPGLFLAMIPVVLLVVFLASRGPMERAARMDLLAALQYE